MLIACLCLAEADRDTLLLLLPSDHIIGEAKEFRNNVSKGIAAARDGKIVTFGVRPQSPHTGYGYIQTGNAYGEALEVRNFTEKPDKQTAQGYIASGDYLWNAGIFLFSVSHMIDAFMEHMPEMYESCRAAFENAQGDLEFMRLDEVHYAKCEDISLDYAIIEKSRNSVCVPLETSWSDLGSWTTVAEHAERRDSENSLHGDITFLDCRNCYGHSTDGASVSLVGLEGVIAIATKDAILVAAKDRAEDVKQIVKQREASNYDSITYHRRVYRPWGWFEGLEKGDRFQVKCLMVKPGEKLSLQSHHHRSEHWVVVLGTAKVTVDEREFLLTENESTYIPIGATHRLENPGRIPALLIEVQSGSYLNEDDIVRYEDVYNRKEES